MVWSTEIYFTIMHTKTRSISRFVCKTTRTLRHISRIATRDTRAHTSHSSHSRTLSHYGVWRVNKHRRGAVYSIRPPHSPLWRGVLWRGPRARAESTQTTRARGVSRIVAVCVSDIGMIRSLALALEIRPRMMCRERRWFPINNAHTKI